jgi:homoserine dehydrogenase
MTRVETSDLPSISDSLLNAFGPEPDASLRTIRVGLAGCGVVGGALVKLLHESAGAIAARHGIRIELSRVLVRDVARDRGVPLTPTVFTNDAASFNQEDVDVVVEAIGGDDTAGEIARSALSRGKKFVTANKQLIASAAPELTALAQRTSASLDFGAAVGGSAPVISLLRDLLGTATPLAVRGILNGTSNYVLTLVERGMSFTDALNAARRKGLAEADCSRDLDGRDAAAKLTIICWLSFGIAPSALCIRRTPLTPSTDRLVDHAAQLGGKVRVISECVALRGQRVTATVDPVVVTPHSSFGRTEFEDNRAEVDLGWSAPLTVSGPGAGGPPTATALLSDLLHSSLPPAQRRPHGVPFVPAEDPREHDWLVVTDSGSQIVVDELEKARRPVLGVEKSGSDTRILARAPRATIARALLPLRMRGLEPSAARMELAERQATVT